MRNEPFAKLDRIAGGQVRPFRAIEPGELGKIRIVNAGNSSHLQQWIPGLGAGCVAVFELFQSSGVWEPNKSNFATASADLLDGRNRIAKATPDRFPDLRH